MSKLYFFRHAQASYGAKNYDQLSPKGEEQSQLLGDYLVQKQMHFDKIFVGPLVRQNHTYEIVAAAYEKANLSIPKPVFLEELKEHEGTEGVKTILPELMHKNPQIKKWYTEIEENPKLMRRNTLLSFQYFMDEWAMGRLVVPNIESWADFRANVTKGLYKILAQTGKGETIGVFTSGGTISSIIAESLQIQNEQRVAALNFSIRNTSITSFLYARQQFNILAMNEIPHLSDEMITFV